VVGRHERWDVAGHIATGGLLYVASRYGGLLIYGPDGPRPPVPTPITVVGRVYFPLAKRNADR